MQKTLLFKSLATNYFFYRYLNLYIAFASKNKYTTSIKTAKNTSRKTKYFYLKRKQNSFLCQIYPWFGQISTEKFESVFLCTDALLAEAAPSFFGLHFRTGFFLYKLEATFTLIETIAEPMNYLGDPDTEGSFIWVPPLSLIWVQVHREVFLGSKKNLITLSSESK